MERSAGSSGLYEIGAGGTEKVVKERLGTKAIREGAVIVNMMESVNASIEERELGEEIITGVFIETANSAGGEHEDGVVTGEEFEFGEDEKWKEVRKANFEKKIRCGHIHSADGRMCLGRMMQSMIEKSVAPVGVKQKTMREVESELVEERGHREQHSKTDEGV